VQRQGERHEASGGFADVWKGRYRGEDVALKVFRLSARDVATGPLLKDFCKEAVVLKYLRHPNITSLLGIETNMFPLCLVCEWMPLGTITFYLTQQPSADRLLLLADVSRGLSYLHDMDIVHGDLKGANILINGKRKACIADFGVAAFSYTDRTVFIPTQSTDTMSIRWTAPEISDPEMFGLERARITKPSDVYALSMVMWEVFTGRFPFHELGRDSHIINKVLKGERPKRPSQATGIGLSDTIWEVMERCWQPDHHERPAVTTVADALEKAKDVAGKLEAPQQWPLAV